MSAWKWVAAAIGLLVLVGLGLATWGAARWSAATRELAARLDAARAPATTARYDARELDGLPAPVQRYFRAVLKDGQPIITAVTIDLAGTFNMSPSGEQWKAFTSMQRVVTHRPGFVWDARIAMLPGLAVHVHDAYLAGDGLLHAAIAGLVTMADLRGGGELARGELMRFFAEAAWYPTAFLPSQGVRWEAVDDRSARATLNDGALSLTLLFRFDADGLMESVRAEARGRLVGKTATLAPWEGRWSDYRVQDGMRVPFTGEVAWLLAEGRRPYWRGTITSLAYEFAPR
jgi:hypothetical protein